MPERLHTPPGTPTPVFTYKRPPRENAAPLLPTARYSLYIFRIASPQDAPHLMSSSDRFILSVSHFGPDTKTHTISKTLYLPPKHPGPCHAAMMSLLFVEHPIKVLTSTPIKCSKTSLSLLNLAVRFGFRFGLWAITLATGSLSVVIASACIHQGCISCVKLAGTFSRCSSAACVAELVF